ncbi:MAG: hypothetical protein HY746_08910 [Elusimicrobia bacterium]|nr:hypothetical protein [Elusimicrobiota bacterium]
MFLPLIFFLFHSFCFAAENFSLEDKVSQLLMISADSAEIEKTSAAVSAGMGGIQLQWGSYSLEDTQKITAELQKTAGLSKNPVPLFIAVDYEGGSVYSPTTLGLLELPTNMMLGAADDEKNTASLFYLAGTELKRAGINMTFGPVLDINTNPGNPIIGVRSIGSEPEQAAKIGAAIINGFKAAGIITAPKHFPGHGASGTDSHKTLPTISLSLEELTGKHMKPFAGAIEAEAPAVMTAHIVYPALDSEKPATLSQKIIFGELKKKFNFQGAVITDSLDMRAITSKKPIPQAAVEALRAGADILLLGKGDFFKTRNQIIKAVKTGKISATRINDAFEKIMALKRKYGLFEEKQYTSEFDKAYLNVSKELSAKSVTLVRVVGIASDTRGRSAAVPKEKSMTGAKNAAIILFSPPRFNETVLELYKGLLDAGYKIVQYNFEINPDRKEYERIMRISGETDFLIIGSFQWAQAQNRNQLKTIKTLLAGTKPCVLVSLMSPYDIENYPEAKTVLATYGITKSSMETAAKIIAGEIRPEGKLPVKIRQ